MHRIAAGEVIERPASVVKELVENSLDAGASRIGVELIAGGKGMIRVSDDGSGMSRADALLSAHRHATSKMRELADIEAIHTFGFRGEALPSVGGVSRMTIETQERSAVTGTRLSVEGGRAGLAEDTCRAPGTTITVEDLFFNTPARRRFLRADRSEFRYAAQIFSELALSSPDVGFSLSHNGNEQSNLQRGLSFTDRIEQVFGRDVVDRSVRVEMEESGIRLEGLIGTPEVARNSRVHQSLFVNRRPVSSRSLNHAIYSGYGGILPRGLYPFFVVFLWLDPGEVDVNVHPTKREVRFSREQLVHGVLSGAIKRHLLGFRSRAISTGEGGETASAGFQAPLGLMERAGTYSSREAVSQMCLPLTMSSAAADIEASNVDVEETIALWQVHRRYIFAPTKGGVLIVDQHVAHERIIYNDVMVRLVAGGTESQQLLFPLVLGFGPAEMAILREVEPLLVELGFGVREFGRDSIVVDAIPVSTRNWNADQVLRAVIDDCHEAMSRSSGSGDLLKDRLAASYACHTAVRAGDALTVAEMQTIIDRLFATDDPFVCPHGRPIVIKLSMEEIDQRFGRS